MRVITERDLRDYSATMDAVQAGETIRSTRNGVPVAELRLVPRQRLSAAEPVSRPRALSSVDYALTRREANAFFGTKDSVGDESGD